MARKYKNQEIYVLLCSIDEGYTPSEKEAQLLANLKLLDLNGTRITALPESIGQLANLEELYLSNTSITALPESIGQLANLEGLNLGFTPITALPESIGQLANLEVLYLINTSITALPESIGQLANLQRLHLSRTRITALPESIGQLANLKELDLSFAPITALPESIGRLVNLEVLNLSRTRITALPESIGQLANLEELYLTDTSITALPESIGQLTGLKFLSLMKTRINSLPDWVRCLERLQTLDLSETEITALPEWIGALPALMQLDLEGLALPKLPKSLALRGLPFVDTANWRYGNTGVNLHGITLTEQDVTIFLEHPELIPTLYEEKTIVLRECRVIFLGDGASGKSYTIKRIRNEGRRETKNTRYRTSETPGVEILDYRIDRGEESFDVHFWDFGGQQLLHSMHRCFLSEETCYVVTVKTRETKADERAQYWLRNVTAFAPRSPILLFVNCWGDDDGRRSIDEPGLCKEFPKIKQVVYCSAKRAEDAEFREKLMEPIFRMAEGSEGVSKKVPAKWDQIRRAIEAESKKAHYLTKVRYHRLCAEYGVENEEAPELLSYFNNLGICFSYHRDKDRQELAEYKLLKPVWLTNAIYAIIEEGRAYAKDGQIERTAIEQMLCNRAPTQVNGRKYRRTVPRLIYKKEECPYILDVAKAHDLCYEVNENTLFFPALCSADTPPAARSAPEGFGQHVSYLLDYSYLPDTVLHQLMIRCMRNRLAVECCWLKGMALYVGNLHRVFVRMLGDETLRIEVYSSGEQLAYPVFWTLREQIAEINRRLNLQAEEYIEDQARSKTDQYSLVALLSAAKDNGFVYGPKSGARRSARELLGSVYEESFIEAMQFEKGKTVIPFFKKEYHPWKKEDPFLRDALLEAYDQKCPYCGKIISSPGDMQVDHILPRHPENQIPEAYLDSLRANGFDVAQPDYIENYFPAHPRCNNIKRNHIDVISLCYWHALAARKAPKVLRLLNRRQKITE